MTNKIENANAYRVYMNRFVELVEAYKAHRDTCMAEYKRTSKVFRKVALSGVTELATHQSAISVNKARNAYDKSVTDYFAVVGGLTHAEYLRNVRLSEGIDPDVIEVPLPKDIL